MRILTAVSMPWRVLGCGEAEQLAAGKADGMFGNCTKIKMLSTVISHPSSPKESESHGVDR